MFKEVRAYITFAVIKINYLLCARCFLEFNSDLIQ